MNIWINGERASTSDAKNIAELASHYGLAPHTVLIEHNGVALHQHEWAQRAVHDGDRIEFVRVVAGG
jgi:sulfur carrier protein